MSPYCKAKDIKYIYEFMYFVNCMSHLKMKLEKISHVNFINYLATY